MIIIIEGLDGVGKTTFSKKFSQKYNFKYIKESYTNSCEEKEKRVKLMLERLMDENNYIYDRTTLIDDFVYGFLNESKSSLSNYFDIIVSILSHCKIYNLTIDEKIRKERFEQRGDDYIKNDMIEKIKQQYENFYSKLEKVKNFELTLDSEKDIERMMEEIKND